MKKRCMSLILVAMFVLSMLSTSAFALESGTSSEFIELETIPISTVQDVEQDDDTTNKLQMIDNLHFVPDIDNTPIADLTTETCTEKSSVSVTQQITDILEEQGSAKYVIFSLAQNQVAQITLRSPDKSNLDYDLMLYKINSEGYTEGPIQTSSLGTYIGHNGHTLDESIGYIRTETGSQQYAVFVYAKAGSSSTDPFTLTISLDLASNLDQYEINDSPYNPLQINMTGDGRLTGANLNVVNDQDWFVWKNTSGFDKLSISVNQGHQVEVYHVENNNQMVLNDYSIKNGARVFNASGLNYIRIFSEKSESNFSDASYTATFHPYRSSAMATQMEVILNGDQGADSYVKYYDTTLFRYKDTLSPIIRVTDSNGNPIEGATITLTLASSYWSEESGNQIQKFYSSPTDSDGYTVLTAKPLATLGTFGVLLEGAQTFMHHVDIDALVFTVDGSSARYSTQVYRLAYSEYLHS